MRKLLGPHLGGRWTDKLDLLRKWQPSLVLVLQPEVEKVRQLREACPQAIIVGRFYHDDSHYSNNIRARPKEFAREIHQEIVGNSVTPLLDYVQSNNETNQDWEGIQKLNEYTQEWMALADQSQAYKCAILAFSVGNPDLPYKPGDPAGFDGRMLYWQQVLPSLNYAQANNHILLLHAYGYPDMFHPDADWYIYRYERQVQANLKTLGITNLKYAYGEIGIDRLIVNGKGGYKVVASDQDYTNQLFQWEKDLQSQALLLGGTIFTFGDSGGWDTYDISSTNVASMIATHYTNHAGDYSPDTEKEPMDTHLPFVGTGTPSSPPLPPREWDARLTARGVTVTTPGVAPGQQFWRVVKARWWNEQESQGRHHIYVEAISNGKSMDGVDFEVFWPGDHAFGKTNGRSGFDAGNFPMSKSLNEFGVGIDTEYPTEVIKGIGMGADGNSGIHTSTGVVFQLVTMPSAGVDVPPSPTQKTAYVAVKDGANIRHRPVDGKILIAVPYKEAVSVLKHTEDMLWATVRYKDVMGFTLASLLSYTPIADSVPPPPPPVTGDDWTRIMTFILRWEGGWADDPNDPGGATNKGITIGTYTRWRKAHGQPAPSKDDLRNISDAEVMQIYKEWYWIESGADKLPWPLNLAHMDTAVNAGTGRAKEMLAQSGGNFLAYMGNLVVWYTSIPNFEHFGRAWIRRRGEILLEAAK